MDGRSRVLVVDDQPDNRMILDELLSEYYVLGSVDNGGEALAMLDAGRFLPQLILLDVMMPQMDGFEVCRRIKANPVTAHIPVIFLTSLEGVEDETYGLSLGAADFIHKPFSPAVVKARVKVHLQLASMTEQLRERNEDLERLVRERTRKVLEQSEELAYRDQELILAQSATITAFCSLAEARDNETGNHIRRTQNYVKALAERLSHHPRFSEALTPDYIQLLYKSAPLHDVGKVGVPDAILLKPGKLNAEEWAIMRQHTEYGRAAIAQAEMHLGDASTSFLRCAREIAYGHHERWDGTGYPQGLAGDEIPLSARLMAVADVYDALISRRVYKPAFSHELAIAMMSEQRDRHFDPDILDTLLAMTDAFQDIARRYNDE